MSIDNQKHNFCTGYVKMIFNQWDKDNSGILDRQELKKWLVQELKDKPLSSTHVKKGFQDLLQGADSNKDGKVDRWELYQHCIKNYIVGQDDLWSWLYVDLIKLKLSIKNIQKSLSSKNSKFSNFSYAITNLWRRLTFIMPVAMLIGLLK